MIINNILEPFGFKYAGTCNCSGYYTEKFKNKPYQISIRTRQGRFRIQKYGVTIIAWKDINELPLHLNALHATIQESV